MSYRGVLGRHYSLAKYFPWMAEKFGLSSESVYACLSGIAHDPIQRGANSFAVYSIAITDSGLRYHDTLVLGRSAPDTRQGRYPAREAERMDEGVVTNDDTPYACYGTDSGRWRHSTVL